jgi:hypothetical protein
MKRSAQRSLRARPRVQTRRRWRRRLLSTALEVESELAPSRCDVVVRSFRVLKSAIVVIRWRWCGSFALFGFQHLEPGDDFIRRQHPIHWNRITASRWATQPQRAVAACFARHVDLAASNNLTANQTVALVIERTPLAKLIKPAQQIQFVYIRKINWRR